MKKYMGFTLSEVLIALVIIGIIAAITVPSIITSLHNQELKTAYKKAYSDLSNATLQGIAFGEFPLRETKFNSDTTTKEWEWIKSRFVVEKLCEDKNLSDCWIKEDQFYNCCPGNSSKAFVDSSGRAWAMYNKTENIYLVDTNGDKGPNYFGKDRWAFTFADNNGKRICGSTVCSNPSLPYKIKSWLSKDYTSYDANLCLHPPCRYYSWLYQ